MSLKGELRNFGISSIDPLGLYASASTRLACGRPLPRPKLELHAGWSSRLSRFIIATLALAAFLFVARAACADNEEKRVALVIGNALYQYVPPLNNPARDANAMTETLSRLRFDVISLVDASRTSMVWAL